MKNLTKENFKRTLGINIDEYLRNNNLKRSAFAEMVNSILGIEKGDEDSNYKKVSRWIAGENVPDTLTMIAISEIIGIDVCNLFKQELNFESRVKGLSGEEKKVLYELLVNSNNGNLKESSMYVPIEYNGYRVELEKKIYSRNQIIDYYKNKSENNFRTKRMMDFSCYYENGFMKDIKSPQKHFPRFCSVKFIENLKDDCQHGILYTDKEEFYKKISPVWSSFPSEEFYNVVYFEERSYEYGTEFLDFEMDKSNYYRAKVIADEVYNKMFTNLLKLGLIKESADVENETEWDDGSVVSDKEEAGKRINIFCDCDSAYGCEECCRSVMFTICFNFEINMTCVEINDLIKSIKGEI